MEYAAGETACTSSTARPRPGRRAAAIRGFSDPPCESQGPGTGGSRCAGGACDHRRPFGPRLRRGRRRGRARGPGNQGLQRPRVGARRGSSSHHRALFGSDRLLQGAQVPAVRGRATTPWIRRATASSHSFARCGAARCCLTASSLGCDEHGRPGFRPPASLNGAGPSAAARCRSRTPSGSTSSTYRTSAGKAGSPHRMSSAGHGWPTLPRKPHRPCEFPHTSSARTSLGNPARGCRRAGTGRQRGQTSHLLLRAGPAYSRLDQNPAASHRRDRYRRLYSR